ncbi:putative Ras family [Monocercomonoides exilis]|uniref:putative Ras family n=1 Tax=Monocercomonoides exilis TaxID=2049356 RepID=UPI003559DAF4|nr:putative Ras family [Monocercomonoides exilis]
MNETEEELKVKVDIIGEYGVGLTSLIQRYVDGHLYNSRTGIGIDCKSKNVSADDKNVQALSSYDSFNNLKEMKKKIDGILASYSNDCPLILIGNGSDQWEHRAVNRFEVEDWCKKEGFCGYFETSAETGENVDEAFTELVRLGLSNHESKPVEADEVVDGELSTKNEKSIFKCFLM